MKPEKLILTSIVGGKKRVRLWESSSPAGFGHPVRWVLERTPEGVRIRSLDGGTDVQQFGESIIDTDQSIPLPGSEIRVQLRRIRPIRAAYLEKAREPAEKALPSLMVFSGVRREVVGSLQVHAAYIAYCKGKPVFSVQNTDDGVKMTLLANKLHLKKSGKPSLTGSPGEVWKLSRESLTASTITRGWYWWRFNLVAPGNEAAELAGGEAEEKDGFIRKTFWATLALLALLFVSSVIFRISKPPVEKQLVIQPPRKSEKIVIYRGPEDKLAKSGQRAPKAAEAQPAPKPAEARVAQSAHPKERPSAGGKSTAKSRAARLAESQARILKEALSGAAGAMAKMAPAQPAAQQQQLSAIFAAKGSVVSETQVKPGFAGTDVKIGEIGGKDATLKGAPGGFGYSTGEHGKVSGQGTSFVSAGIGGSFVDNGLSKEEVGAVIHAHMDEIRYCHESAMLTNPGIQGKLVVDFRISPAGLVESSSVESSSLLPDTSIQACLLKRLAEWKFPKPHGGVHVSVSYPFLFKTLSRE